MARTTDRPATATRPTTATAQQATNVSGSFDEQDRRSGDGQLGNNSERRENLTAVRDKPDNERDDSSENRDERANLNRRGEPDNRHDRGFGENRDERKPHEGYAEQGSWLRQPLSPSAGLDAFAPMLEAWKQVFKSWSDLAESMMKVQQDAFAGMIGAANATAKELVSSGSRTTASTPDRIEHDRR
jgi:hypothetical protein